MNAGFNVIAGSGVTAQTTIQAGTGPNYTIQPSQTVTTPTTMTETSGDSSNVNWGNGLAHYYNPSAGAISFSWTFANQPSNSVTCGAISFLAANGPLVTVQPQNQTVFLGSTGTFTVTATTSGGTLSYQWQQFISGTWTNVGTNSTSYTTGATGYADAGDLFRVLVTDSNGTTTSAVATLIVVGIASVAWLQ